MTIKLSSKVQPTSGYLPEYTGSIISSPSGIAADMTFLDKVYPGSTAAALRQATSSTSTSATLVAANNATIRLIAKNPGATDFVGNGSVSAFFTDSVNARLYAFSVDTTNKVIYTDYSDLAAAGAPNNSVGQTAAIALSITTMTTDCSVTRASESAGNFFLQSNATQYEIDSATGALVSQIFHPATGQSFVSGDYIVQMSTFTSSIAITNISMYKISTGETVGKSQSLRFSGVLIPLLPSAGVLTPFNAGAGRIAITSSVANYAPPRAFLLKAEFDAYIAQIAAKLGL